MCIRQYSKNTQKPVLQGRNESTSRKVRTLVSVYAVKTAIGTLVFPENLL